MRFKSYMIIGGAILALAGQSFPGYAQSSYDDYTSLTETRASEPRQQRGRQVHQLRTDPALHHHLFARRLGEISAMDSKDGTLFVADKRSGQIFRLPDRDGNGQTEGARPMPHRFDEPTGLAAAEDALYVADRSAVWRVSPAGTPVILAGLTNADTTGLHHLEKSATAAFLWLGLTTQSGQAKLLRLSTLTGEAELIDEAEGTLLDMSAQDGARPWMLLQKGADVFLGPSFEFMSPVSLEPGHMVLPANEAGQNWPPELSQHVVISRDYSGDVMAAPIVIAKPLPIGRALLSGFTAPSGRQKWGETGSLHLDSRGLFVADSVNGDLWRLSRSANPKLTVPSNSSSKKVDNKTEDESSRESSAATAPDDISSEVSTFSSSIERGSTIDQLSTIDRGSLIGRASTLRPREEIEAEKEKIGETAAD